MSGMIGFGAFELDVQTGELRKRGIRLQLPEQSFQMLLLLLEHPGEVVTRDDIRLKLWPNDTVVDFDHSISTAMRRLRSALGESAESPKYIETVSKRGYRFIGIINDSGAAEPRARSSAAPYRLLEKLGEGGMGVVYRAEDLRLGRQVAIKLLPSHTQRFESLLRQEARLASALNHPNICTIFGLEFFDGRSGIVMELLEGETLTTRVSRGPIPLPEALSIARQVAGALAEAHAAGIVHRDLKPANIMLTKNGPKVLDFGLALQEQTGPPPGEATSSTEETEAPGTVAYLSPEQIQGKVLDARSDIFSLGLVFYEMLSRRRPFEGESAGDFRMAVLTRPSAPLNGVPERVAGIVSRCLAKAPEDRWTSAQELKDELERIARVPDDLPSTPPRTRRHLIAIAAAALLIASALGFGLGYQALRTYRADASAGRLTVSRVTGTGDIRGADISADGKYVAYVRKSEGRRSIWLKQPTVEGDIQLVDCGEERCGGVTFSPDRSMLYFTRRPEQNPEGALFRLPVLGGAPEIVFRGISGAPAFSPDGRRVAFVRSSKVTHGEDVLVTRTISGNDEREVARYPAPGIHHNTVVWTSDGQRLVYFAMGKLTALPAGGGIPEPIADQSWNDWEDLAPSPYAASEVLLAGSRLSAPSELQIFRVPLFRAGVVQLTPQVNRPVGVRAAANGDLLVVEEDRPRSIQVVTNGVTRPAINTERRNISGGWGVRWTPDGRILFASRSPSNERNDLWVMNADGSGRRRLTRSPDLLYFTDAVMSSKADFVVTTVWEPGDKASIWRLNIAEGTIRQLSQGRQDFPPAISPDGKWVVYKTVQTDRPVIMKVSSEGGPASPVTNYACDYPAISPDGKWIACLSASDKSKPAELLIVPFAGGPPAKVIPLPSTAKPDVRLAWTPDGSSVAFVNRVNGVSNIWSQPINGRGPSPATHFSSQDIYYFDWSPDGRIVLSQGEDVTDAMLIRGLPGSK